MNVIGRKELNEIDAHMNWFNRQPITIKAAVVTGIFTIAATGIGTLLPGIYDAVVMWFQDDPYIHVFVKNGGSSAILDVRVINPTETILFVNEVELVVDSTRNLLSACCATPPSERYHLRLDQPLQLTVAHAIAPDNVDRFQIFIIQPSTGTSIEAVYGHLVVRVNQDHVLKTNHFGFRVGTAGPGEKLSRPSPNSEGRLGQGWRNVRREPFPNREVLTIVD